LAPVKNGDKVKVFYTGEFNDGNEFGTSSEGEHIEFTIGEGKIIPGFEQAVIGMNPGESKTLKITAEKAYGLYNKEMVEVVDRNQFPDHLTPKVGQRLEIPQADDKKIIVTVTEVTESKVTLDANHPLAGKDLTYYIQLIEII